MKPSRLLLVALVALTFACQRKVEGALRVELTTTPALAADCLRVTVFDGDTALRFTTFKRAKNGSPAQQVGIVRADEWPKTISLEGSAWLGDCAGDPGKLKLNAHTGRKAQTFPETGVEVVPMNVDVPGLAEDADGDGYSASADCRDDNRAIFPGSTQLCNQDEDNDCDGLSGCADSECTATMWCTNPPDRLELTGLPVIARTGDCIDFAVSLRNPLGTRAATRATLVQLAATPTMDLFANPGCTGSPATQAKVPFLAVSAAVSARLSKPGTQAVNAQSTGLTPANGTFIVEPQPWTKLTMTGAPATQAAGDCSAPITLGLLDALDRPTVVNQPLTLALTTAPTIGSGLFTTADCSGTPATTVDIAGGAGTVTVRFRSTRVGAVDLRATANTQLANAMVTVTAGPAKKLFISNGRLALRTSETCSAGSLVIEVRDEFDNPTTAPRAVVLTPSSSLGGVAFFDGSSACTTGVTSLTLNQASASASFRMRATTTGTGTFTVLASTLFDSVSQPFDVGVGDPVALVFTNAPRNPAAGTCSAELTLELRDASGTPSSFGSANNVTVSLTPATLPAGSNFGFYTQAGCVGARVNPGGTFMFPAGQAQARLYFYGEKVLTTPVTVNAAIGAAITGNSPGHTIVPSTPAKLVWTAPGSTTLAAGACSSSYTLRLFDAFDNVTTFSTPTAFTVTSTPAGLTFDTALGQCNATSLTFPAANSATLQARGTIAGPYTFTATGGGATSTTAAPLTITPNSTTSLMLTTPTGAPSLTAGTCQELRFDRRDSFGNAAAATPLTMTLPVDGGVTVYDTLATCQVSTTPGTSFTLPGNTNARSVWAQPRKVDASPVTLTGTLGGNSATATLVVNPANATRVLVEGLPVSRESNVCSGVVTLRRRDQFGNDATNGALSVGMTIPVGVAVTGSADCTGAPSTGPAFAAGQAVSSPVSLLAPLVGAYAIGFDAGLPLAAGSTFTVTAGPAARWEFTTTPPASLETATCSGAITARLTDAAGNLVTTSGVAVTLASSASPPVVFAPGSACVTSTVDPVSVAGVATFSFTAPNAPQALTISATSTGFAVPTTQNWTIALGPPRLLVWKAPPPLSLPRATCSNAVTLELRDRGNNAVTTPTPLTASLNVGTGTPGFTFFSDATCVTPISTSLIIPAAATEVTFFMAATGSGATTLGATATAAGLTPAPAQPITITGAPTALTLASTVTQLEAGGCAQVTIARPGVTLGSTPITLSGVPAEVTLHALSNCTGAAPALTIPHGSSALVLYARGRSAAFDTPFSLSASDPSGGFAASNLVSMTTYPLVRRGSCDLVSGASSCTVAVGLPFDDISRTFLSFQATGAQPNANQAFVTCRLKTTPVEIVCTRKDPNSTVSVRWQTASFGLPAAMGGVTVRHLSNTVPAGVSEVTETFASVDPTRSFVLASWNSATNGNAVAADFPAVALIDATSLKLTAPTAPAPGQLVAGSDYSVQVVEVAGARVARGVSPNNLVGTVGAYSVLPANPLANPATVRTLLVATVRTPGGGSESCNRRFRVTSMSSTIRRADGLTGVNACSNNTFDAWWEFIEWPAGAVTDGTTVTIASGALSAVANVTVVGHKTLVFFGAQGPGGQSSGSTESTQPEIGTASATAAVGPASITVTRGSSNSDSRFTTWTVTLDP